MATSIKLFLDTRNKKKDGTYTLKLTVVVDRKSAQIPIGVSVPMENWIQDRVEGKIANKDLLNSIITTRYNAAQNLLLRLELTNEINNYSHNQIKDLIIKEWGIKVRKRTSTKQKHPLHFANYIQNHIKIYTNKGTKQQYIDTLRKVSDFCDTEKLLISDITVSWLKDFDAFCLHSGMTINGKSFYLRAIRTIFNDAIDRDLIGYDKYPFRRFKIKKTTTKHRNIPIERLREMLHFNQEEFVKREKLTANKHTNVFPNVQKYLDLFFLSFYLCGMNIKDLLFLKNEDIVNEQLSILRAKTNTHILLKIEPEAQAIIDKYRGKKYLLNFLDTYKTDDYKTFLSKMNKAIQRAFPGITSYWARHSWATIAAELDIPDPIIDIAQGRKPKGMASIYINRNLKKVSEANRKVIDYLYEKATLTSQ